MPADMIKPIVSGQTVRIPEPAAAGAQGMGKVHGRQEPAAGGASLPSQPLSGPTKASEVRQAVSDLNDYVQTLRRDLQFSVDEDSGRTIIKVIDSETKELIRQIPPEEVLALARHLDSAEGLILRDHA